MAALSSVSEIELEPTISLKRPIIEGPATIRPKNEILAEWNVEHMNVPQVWAMGINGTGVVVGIIDTGVRFVNLFIAKILDHCSFAKNFRGTHEAIREQYRNDGRAWRDPYNQYMVPTDIYNHGTHTTGSVLGRYFYFNNFN